jgi:hypothetical protein
VQLVSLAGGVDKRGVGLAAEERKLGLDLEDLLACRIFAVVGCVDREVLCRVNASLSMGL